MKAKIQSEKLDGIRVSEALQRMLKTIRFLQKFISHIANQIY